MVTLERSGRTNWGCSRKRLIALQQDLKSATTLPDIQSFQHIPEDVIPTATVQTTGVITQLIDDFIHLEDSHDSFNKNSTTNSTTGNVKHILSDIEDIIPESRIRIIVLDMIKRS